MPIVDTVEPWCYEATRDNIRHYAHGIGDDNPLWCDPAYAAGDALRHDHRPAELRVRRSTGSCPATSAVCPASTPCGRVPTSTGIEPIRRGTEVRTEAHLKDLVEHQTSFAGRAFQQIYHVELYDTADVLLGAGDSWCFRTERDTARTNSGTKYDEASRRPPMHYDAETIERIHELYAGERCGAPSPGTSRTSVAVGDVVPHDRQGADDGDRLHRLRPGMGRPLHPGQQAGVPAAAQAPRPRHPGRLRHPGRARAGALGQRPGRRWWVRRRPTTTGPSDARG